MDDGRSAVMSVRDAFYDVLRTHGITTIFGNPGSNELPLLKHVPDDFRYVLALQEGVAVGLADGYAQASGTASVVNLHAAAGTGNAMGTLTNTQSGHVPVVVTSGQQSRRYAALNAMLTNVDAPQLARPLVKWSTEPLRAEGLLPAGVGTVADRLAGHDLVAVFGAAVFRYHEAVDGDYLAAGADLWSVTADPDEAARAPMGHAVVGDPSDALTRVAALVPSRKPAGPSRPGLPAADADGPPFTAEAILDAVDAAKDDNTVIVLEWTSADMIWDRLDLTRPGSLYFPASGGLGWGLPAAIGVQLADPARRVIALIGDGALQYTVSGLWTAARHHIPVVFVVPRNQEYAALKQFTRLMDAPDTPGLELPGMDVAGLADAYGVPAVHTDTLDDFTAELRRALAATGGPRLVSIPQRRFAGDQP